MVYNGVNRKGIFRLWCNKRNNISNNKNNDNIVFVTICASETNDERSFMEQRGGLTCPFSHHEHPSSIGRAASLVGSAKQAERISSSLHHLLVAA